MGHDIFAFDAAGNEVAYARFNMGNHNAVILYHLLDADKFYAGVSGSGGSAAISVQQTEKAFSSYNESYNIGDSLDKKQISEFLSNCLETAKKEGSVKVYFG
jgi:hypothetical protein